MTVRSFNRFWMLATLLLIAIIAVSGTVAWSSYSGSQPIEITLLPSQEPEGDIYIGGAVNNPGLYPLTAGDSIADAIQAAGGTTGNADFNRLRLLIPKVGEEAEPQKIDINRAEIWLLEALPGIGEVRAKAIVDYRCQNGPFHNINELIKVEGISTITYEQIKESVTVAD